MKKLLLLLILSLSLFFSKAQNSNVYAIVYGVNDDYTKSFCKELTSNNIPWSLCDILDNVTGKACNDELLRVANKYYLRCYENIWVPIVKVIVNGVEYGFNVAADRTGVMSKIKTVIGDSKNVYVIVYGVSNDYTSSFCKELTDNKIPWSLCNILDNVNGKACNDELLRVVDKYHLKCGENLWVPIVKVIVNGVEYGFNVGADRANVIGKIKSTIITDYKEYKEQNIQIIHNIIMNPYQKQIEVYSITGSLLLSSKELEININELKPNVYIIKTNNYTKKYVKM